MPRLRHFMFRQVFEKAYEKHLRAIFKTWRGIWKASERFISLRKHMRETSERFISLRTHLKDIWETYIKSIMFSYICLTLPIKSVVFSRVWQFYLSETLGFQHIAKKTLRSVMFLIHDRLMYQFLRGSFSENVLPLSHIAHFRKNTETLI